MIYLDHNATTPLLPQVKETLKELFGEEYGNPSSPYLSGRRARDLLEESRHRLAELLGAKPSELIFTSGGRNRFWKSFWFGNFFWGCYLFLLRSAKKIGALG